MASLKTHAIVLKRRNQGESDRVLTLFSVEEGIISAIARGSRKPKNRFASSTNLFTSAEYLLSTGKTFYLVSDVSIIKSYFNKNESLEQIMFADAMAETIIKLFPEKVKIADVYKALIGSLENLGLVNSKIVLIFFLSKIFQKLGSFPELNSCISCHEKLKDDTYFSPIAGGFYCRNCSKNGFSMKTSHLETIKLWRFLSTCSEDKLRRIKSSEEAIDELFAFSTKFLSESLEVELKSLTI